MFRYHDPEATLEEGLNTLRRCIDEVSKRLVVSPGKYLVKVVDQDGSPVIKVTYLGEEKTFTPQEISAMVLTKMKDIAEAKLGKTVKKAVVT